MNMKIAVAALSLALITAPSAYASCDGIPGYAAELLIKARYFDLICRGSLNIKEADDACEKRTIVSSKLNACGWCYGKKGQYGSQMDWHKCTKNSYHVGDTG
jgi:hypothetical protein